ncbi:MAG TPA: hypothetical protein DCP63_07870 [Bacteroidetes bacterium]|nr:hypothetical protein [Bacteroidota bacterium]
MDDEKKSKSELLSDLSELRLRVAALEAEEADHRKTKEKLHESQRMLQLVLDTIPQRVFWKDHNFVYLGCNKAFAKDAGVDDPDLIVGKNDFELGWKEVAHIYRDDDAAVMKSGRPKLNFEEPQSKPDGGRLWLQTSKVPLHDREGKVIGVLGTYADITDRKQVEESIQRERSLLRILVDNLPDPIYFKNSKGEYILNNRAHLKSMGMERQEDVLGKTTFDFHPREMAESYHADEMEIIQSGKALLGREEISLHKDINEERWHLTSKIPIVASDGTVTGIVGISRDITQEKRMQEAVRESVEKFRLVFENAYDGISLFEEADDPGKRRLVECNARYAEMAGRSREELLRIGTTEGMAKSLSEDNTTSIEQVVTFRGSFTWFRPDGKDNIIEYTAVPIKLQGKTYTIGIDRDVTERRRAEAEREKLIDELQQAIVDIKTLSGLVPICSNCKKIRDDHGFWTNLEKYIQERTPAHFSHGICPDCAKKLYPDYFP